MLIFSSSRALCEEGRPGKYYHHTYFCRKAALLCSSLKGMSAGVITGTWFQLYLWDGNAFARPMVLQMSTCSGDHLTSRGPSACLPLNVLKKNRISSVPPAI